MNYEVTCEHCKLPFNAQISQITLMELCVDSIWNSKVIQEKNLDDELKKDMAVSLFIQTGMASRSKPTYRTSPRPSSSKKEDEL